MHFSQLAVSPLYIIVTLMCTGYLIFCIKDKGCVAAFFKFYAVLHICIYIMALYLYAKGE